MAFIVEDGSGVLGATSYASLLLAQQYFEDRGVVEWENLNAEQQSEALIKGSSYADLRWGNILRDRPLKDDQGLELPRKNLTDRYGRSITGLPTNWINGVLEYALIASQGGLYSDPIVNPDKEVKSERVVVGPITKDLTFVTSSGISNPSSFVEFTKPDNLCKAFTTARGMGGRVIV